MKYNNADLDYLDKHYGENFAKMCRTNFPVILEYEGVLKQLITESFAPTHSLYNDLVSDGRLTDFKSFIFSLFFKLNLKPKNGENRSNKSPEELMSDAGYILFPECKTEDDIQFFKKYYAAGEEICTFNGGRLDDCRVWFAIKKDAVDQLSPKYRRENFTNPTRQDDYGTSVISIQFSRNDKSYVSIKNRYNHKVSNPDATFGNNLDNIIDGLTVSFIDTYGLNLENNMGFYFGLNNYVVAGDGKFYRYNLKSNDGYFCENNIFIDTQGQVSKFIPEKYILFDNNVLDLSSKSFINDNDFTKSIGKIKNIDVRVNKQDKSRLIHIVTEFGEPVDIVIDRHNALVGYYNPNIVNVPDDYLSSCKTLQTIDLPNAEKIGDNFLYSNETILEVNIPKAKEMGNCCLCSAKAIKNVEFPKLEKIGYNFLYDGTSLESVNLPSAKIIGANFAHESRDIMSINAPMLSEVGTGFLYYAKKIKEIDFQNLENIANNFLCHGNSLTSVNLPNAKKIGNNFLRFAINIKNISLPVAEEIGDYFASESVNLETIDLPLAIEIGDRFAYIGNNIKNLNLQSVKKVGDYFLSNCRSLSKVSLPKKVPKNVKKAISKNNMITLE